MTDEDIKEQIKRHEGFRGQVYLDSVGIPTGGYGHAFLENSSLPQVVCDELFKHDYKQSAKGFKMLAARFGLAVNDVRRGVLINLMFNLGYYRLTGFKRMIAALQSKDWDLAADEMIDSKWYTQVGRRGVELVKQMREGK